jgi:uncharacterized protein (DUF952 family)
MMIYKILRAAEWSAFERDGIFYGSADDRRDGFIHFSAADQLAGTLAKHFSGEDNLVLLALDERVLGHALKWEASRGGELFPHLYASPFREAVLSVSRLARAPDGTHMLPNLA